MSFVCVIPARGGSKRIPRKNIRLFLERPVLAYPIEAALRCGMFSRVIVSTDDEEIAVLARSFGAEVPFMRSAANSDDHATTVDVLEEVFTRLAEAGEKHEVGCCVYPTASLVTEEQLANIMNQLLNDTALDSVIAAVRFEHPIQRALVIRNERAAMMHPEYRNARSQDLEPAYHDAGHFYAFRVEPLRRNKTLFGPNTAAFILSQNEAQDIDCEEDWHIAELKYLLRQKRAQS